MTTLREQCDAINAQLPNLFTPEQIGLMKRSREDLRQSGILDKVLKVGDHAPAFHLKSAAGHMVDSKQLLTRGPLVVNFYRGGW
jgi:hypothetical protein